MDRSGFTWRSLEIPRWSVIQTELAHLPDRIQRKNPVFWQTGQTEVYQEVLPTLFEWFAIQQLEVRMIAYVSIPAGYRQTYHRDLGCALALQLPVMGCDGVYTGFYRTRGEDKPVFTSNSNHTYHNYPASQVVEYDRYPLLGPVWADVSLIHSVQNLTDHPRHAISVRFREDPWHLVDNYSHDS
jgi:hypothetical protein